MSIAPGCGGPATLRIHTRERGPITSGPGDEVSEGRGKALRNPPSCVNLETRAWRGSFPLSSTHSSINVPGGPMGRIPQAPARLSRPPPIVRTTENSGWDAPGAWLQLTAESEDSASNARRVTLRLPVLKFSMREWGCMEPGFRWPPVWYPDRLAVDSVCSDPLKYNPDSAS